MRLGDFLWREYMNINLREEAVSEYILLYRNYLEDIQNLNKKVINVFDEVIEITKYDKLQEQIFKIIDVYNETIVNRIEAGVFSAWEESDGSLQACLKTYRAGEEAYEVCVQIQLQMKELLIDILKTEERERIITDRPIVSDDELVRLEEICKSAQMEMDELKLDYLSKIENKNVENDIYGTLKSLIDDISINIENFFEEAWKTFHKLQEFVNNISLQLSYMSEENIDKKAFDTATEYNSQANSDGSYEILEGEKVNFGKYKVGIEEIEIMKVIFRKIAPILAKYEEVVYYSNVKDVCDKEHTSKVIKKGVEGALQLSGKAIAKSMSVAMLEPIGFIVVTSIAKKLGKNVGKKIGKQSAKVINQNITTPIINTYYQSENVRKQKWKENKKMYERELNTVQKCSDDSIQEYDYFENQEALFDEEWKEFEKEIEDFYRERYIYNIQRPLGYKTQEHLLEKNEEIFSKHKKNENQQYYTIMAGHAGPTATQIELSIFAAKKYLKDKYESVGIDWSYYSKEYLGIFLNLFRAGLEVNAEMLGWPISFANSIADELYDSFKKENMDIDLSMYPSNVQENISKLINNV